ncbi:unnamed protein product [Closterium sp. Yama58-4]|nr:unnamed protein product [Closterium sp. Yama58-4]
MPHFPPKSPIPFPRPPSLFPHSQPHAFLSSPLLSSHPSPMSPFPPSHFPFSPIGFPSHSSLASRLPSSLLPLPLPSRRFSPLSPHTSFSLPSLLSLNPLFPPIPAFSISSHFLPSPSQPLPPSLSAPLLLSPSALLLSSQPLSFPSPSLLLSLSAPLLLILSASLLLSLSAPLLLSLSAPLLLSLSAPLLLFLSAPLLSSLTHASRSSTPHPLSHSSSFLICPSSPLLCLPSLHLTSPFPSAHLLPSLTAQPVSYLHSQPPSLPLPYALFPHSHPRCSHFRTHSYPTSLCCSHLPPRHYLTIPLPLPFLDEPCPFAPFPSSLLLPSFPLSSTTFPSLPCLLIPSLDAHVLSPVSHSRDFLNCAPDSRLTDAAPSLTIHKCEPEE